jgi:hypothetical protein
MGLIDRFAERVAKQIVKAPNLPSGAITVTEQQMRQTGANTTYGQTVPLERAPNLAGVPFAPGQPIIPGAINPPRPTDGRPDPRRYEFQVAQNINITETRLVPFRTLRVAADQIDILRRCIEVQKAKILGFNWDITLGEDSAEKIISEIGGARVRAMAVAREKYTEDINRVRQFWEQPDKGNGLLFYDWLNIALEEILVLDAWAIWPQMTVGGELHGLQILDGSTIKPLIDDRGMRPMPPYSAYQQILYGFPRSEFSAPNENEKADGEFTSDELAYFVRNRRTTSVYGYSPTERALPLADIYLRRQQWLRAEYTDGVTPELLMQTDANFGNNPDLLRAYENIFNSDLAGQTEQRKRVRLLPAGMTPVQFDGYGERFKSTLDEYLVNSICGHYGVTPAEIGFNPDSGLGGAGWQDGQIETGDVLGALPLATWVGKMISHLSYMFLGMPRELEFRFMEGGREDTEASARTTEINIKSGTLTLNEARSRAGLPLIEAPEADMPILVAGTGAYLVTDSGLKPIDETVLVTEDGQATTQEEIVPVAEKPAIEEGVQNEEKSVQEELKQFVRWLKKSPTRSFRFKEVPVVYAEVLNKFIAVKDYDSARWYAERYLA